MLLTSVRKGLQAGVDVRLGGLLIGALYASVFAVARAHSVDQFHLSAGVRVSALLVCPVRLWPYLILGEYCYLGYLRYPLIETRGLPWVIIGSIVVMPSVAALVLLQRRLVKRNPAVGVISIAIAAAVVATALNVISVQLLWASPHPIPWELRTARYVLGNMFGILSLAPFAILWLNRERHGIAGFIRPGLTFTCLALIVLLGFLASQVPSRYAGVETTLQLLMALPAAAITCLHGWRGAAIALPPLYLAIWFSMDYTGKPWSFDPRVFTIQQMIMVMSISLLSLGSSLTYYHRRYCSSEGDTRRTLDHVKRTYMAGELERRERARDMNQIGDQIDAQLGATANWLRVQGHHIMANNLDDTSVRYSRKFREQASRVYPTAVEHVGLYLALQVGGISEAWSNTARVAEPRLIGDPCALTVELQLAAYRALTEATSLLMQHERGQVRIHARCGTFSDGRGLMVVAELLDRGATLAGTTQLVAVERLTGWTLAYGERFRAGVTGFECFSLNRQALHV